MPLLDHIEVGDTGVLSHGGNADSRQYACINELVLRVLEGGLFL